MDPDQIKTHPELSNLFLKDPKIVTAIKDDMDKSGFNPAYPIVVGFGEWANGEDVVVDGHTRLQVAMELGLADVETVYQEFPSLLDAIEFAVNSQKNRRNLSPGELNEISCKIDKLREQKRDNAGKFTVASGEAADKPAKSAEETARVVGTSRSTVERIRAIDRSPDEDVKKAVKKNEISISKGYTEVQQRKEDRKAAAERPHFGISGREWALWTWNPVTGCEHGCEYCYPRDIAKKKFKDDFKPKFHEDRLSAHKNTIFQTDWDDDDLWSTNNVLVCSMGDLFGEWVPKEWIDSVLTVCAETPQLNYIFLTKTPKRYAEFTFPNNSWIGATVDFNHRMKPSVEALKAANAPVRFISFAPLKERISPALPGIDWVMIGAQRESTGEPAFQPEWEWVEEILNAARRDRVPVYFKPNLAVRPQEYPKSKNPHRQRV